VGLGLIVVGAVLLIPALVILLQAGVAGLVEYGIKEPWAALIVGGAALLIGVILALIGSSRLKADRLVPNKTIHQVQRDISVARDQLRDHLTPGQLVDDTLDYARDTVGGEFLHNLSRQAAANPLSVCVFGAGLAWMMLSNSQTASRLGRRSGDGLSRTRATLETTARSIGGQAWNNTGEQGSFIGESAASAYDLTKSRVASLMAAARDNRLSVCLIGAGIAWIMLSNSRTASHLGAKASDQLSRGTESVRDAFGEAGQRIAETAQDTSDRIKQGVVDARSRVLRARS
jgi:hypothetical protein